MFGRCFGSCPVEHCVLAPQHLQVCDAPTHALLVLLPAAAAPLAKRSRLAGAPSPAGATGQGGGVQQRLPGGSEAQPAAAAADRGSVDTVIELLPRLQQLGMGGALLLAFAADYRGLPPSEREYLQLALPLAVGQDDTAAAERILRQALEQQDVGGGLF